MTDKVKIGNRKIKLQIKKNYKLKLNPKVINALKDKVNIDWGENRYALNLRNNTAVKIYKDSEEKEFTDEFKKVDKNDLTFVGDKLFDTRTKKVIKTSDKNLKLKKGVFKNILIKNNKIFDAPPEFTIYNFVAKGTKLFTNGDRTSFYDDSFYEKVKFGTPFKEVEDKVKKAIYEKYKDSPYEIENLTLEHTKQNLKSSPKNLTSQANFKITLVLDGEDKHKWDTGENKCVFDWLKWVYGNEDGFKKVVNNEKNLFNLLHRGDTILYEDLAMTEEDFNKLEPYCEKHIELFLDNNNEMAEWNWDNYKKLRYGVSVEQINNFAKYFNLSHIALDMNEKIIFKYTPEKRRHKQSLHYRVFNNHIYPIENREQKIAISNRGQVATGLGIAKDEKEKKEKKLNSIKEVIDIYNEDPFRHMAKKIMETGKQVKKGNVGLYKTEIKNYILEDIKYVFHNNGDQTNLAKDYCELNEIEYKGQTITQIVNGLFEDFMKDYSYPNPNVNKLLTQSGVKNRTHIGKIDNNKPDDEFNGKCYDINKCYTDCILNPSNKWIILDFNSIPKKFNCLNQYSTLDNGLYFVETNDIKLLHGSNIYSKAIVWKALKEKLITTDNIKWYIPAERELDKEYFKPLFGLYKKHSKNNVILNKNLNNLTTGLLGKDTIKSSSVFLTTAENEAFDYLTQYNNTILRQEFTPFGNIYLFGHTNEPINLMKHNLPIYIQILDESNIRLYDMIKKATDGDFSKCLYRKTDMAMIKDGKKLRLGNERGDYRNENTPKYLHKNFYEYRNIANNYNLNIGYKPQNIVSSDNWLKTYNCIIENGGCMLEGRAGTGKSYAIKKIYEKFNENFEKKAVKLAFTNMASLNIGGQTIHKFCCIDSEGNIPRKRLDIIGKNYGLIIVDEMSMINKDLWSLFGHLKNFYPEMKFLIVGDWRQLPPIEEDGNNYEYKYHPTIIDICCGELHYLTKTQRYDKELEKASENVMDIQLEDYPNTISLSNICFTNKKRIQVNKFVNDTLASRLKENEKKLIKEPLEFLQKKENKNANNYLWIYEGLKLISHKGNKEFDICNNERFEIHNFDKDKIIIKNIRPNENGEPEERTIEWDIKKIQNQFYMAYCITTHKSQGTTIEGNLTIHEWNKMDSSEYAQKLKYTAITRATKNCNIYLCD